MLQQLRKSTLEITDERVRLTNEVINGIRVIKFFAWEDLFNKKVSKVRRQELIQLFKTAVVRTTWVTANFAFPIMTALITFSLYVFVGDLLSRYGISVSYLFTTPEITVPYLGTIPSYSYFYEENFQLTAQKAFVSLNLFTKLEGPVLELIAVKKARKLH